MNLNMDHAPGDQQVSILEVYACVFRLIQSTMRMGFKQISLKHMVTYFALMKENVYRDALLSLVSGLLLR